MKEYEEYEEYVTRRVLILAGKSAKIFI